MLFNRARELFVVGVFVFCGVFMVTGRASYGQTTTQTAGGMAGMANLSREEQIARHEKMIGMHTKMIECLKSNKAIPDCHQEMMQACAAIHGGSCPMMGMMSEGKGMMGKGKMPHGKMMNQGATSSDTAPSTGAPEIQPKK